MSKFFAPDHAFQHNNVQAYATLKRGEQKRCASVNLNVFARNGSSISLDTIKTGNTEKKQKQKTA